MLYIGIDTGTHTGFAVWDDEAGRLVEVSSMTITEAMDRVKELAASADVALRIEDPRLRRWFGHTGRERLRGAGSVCRDAAIWERFCRERGLRCDMVAPKNNCTKLSALRFRDLTGYTGRTNEHGRDAAMLVFHAHKVTR